MTTRSKGPLAGFGWLARGIKVGLRHPRPLLGGAALLLLACLLPSLLTLPMRLHAMHTGTPPTAAAVGWTMAGSMLLGLLIMPLYAGYLQVIDAAERGVPARARDIFGPYRDGDALRLIGFGLLMLLVYAAVVVIVVAAAGGGLIHWYMQVLTAPVSQPPALGLPDGFMTAIALFIVLGLFMTGVYAISLGQVALRRRGVFGALADGLAGALKNVLPLVSFALSLVLAWLVVGIAVMLIALLLALLGKLAGGWLVLALAAPLYIVLLLAMFAVMFGVMYHLWRDVCDEGVASGSMASTAA